MSKTKEIIREMAARRPAQPAPVAPPAAPVNPGDLTPEDFRIIRAAGYMEHLDDADMADVLDGGGDPEASMWRAIKNHGVTDMLDLADCINDETGWGSRDSAQMARDIWPTVRKWLRIGNPHSRPGRRGPTSTADYLDAMDDPTRPDDLPSRPATTQDKVRMIKQADPAWQQDKVNAGARAYQASRLARSKKQKR